MPTQSDPNALLNNISFLVAGCCIGWLAGDTGENAGPLATTLLTSLLAVGTMGAMLAMGLQRPEQQERELGAAPASTFARALQGLQPITMALVTVGVTIGYAISQPH